MSDEPEVITGEVLEPIDGPTQTLEITLPDAIVERLHASAEEYAADRLAEIEAEGPEYAGLAIYKVDENGNTRLTGTAFELDECPTCHAFTTTRNKVDHADWHQRTAQTGVDAYNMVNETKLMVMGLSSQITAAQNPQ